MKIHLNELTKVKGVGEKTISRVREHFLKENNYISKYNPDLKLDESSINLGDCLELMNGIKEKSVDMILADLPYEQTQNNWDSIIDLDKLWLQYERIIKDNGAIILFGKKKFKAELIFSNINWYKYSMIWIKSRPSGFLNAQKIPLDAHEEILVFYNKLPKYNPQFHEGIPLHGMGKKFKKEKSANNNYGDFNSNKNPSAKREGDTTKYPRTDLYFKKPHPPIHPTQKPVKLFEYLIKTYTNKGELVLDNASGSGTTAIACINTNRKYICIEKKKEYYNESIKRVKNQK